MVHSPVVLHLQQLIHSCARPAPALPALIFAVLRCCLLAAGNMKCSRSIPYGTHPVVLGALHPLAHRVKHLRDTARHAA